MTKVTWTLYLVGAALIVASWIGLVPGAIGWLGWILATGIALWSWTRRPVRVARRPAPPQEKPKPDYGFSTEEIEAARREVHGE